MYKIHINGNYIFKAVNRLRKEPTEVILWQIKTAKSKNKTKVKKEAQAERIIRKP